MKQKLRYFGTFVSAKKFTCSKVCHLYFQSHDLVSLFVTTTCRSVKFHEIWAHCPTTFPLKDVHLDCRGETVSKIIIMVHDSFSNWQIILALSRIHFNRSRKILYILWLLDGYVDKHQFARPTLRDFMSESRNKKKDWRFQ